MARAPDHGRPDTSGVRGPAACPRTAICRRRTRRTSARFRPPSSADFARADSRCPADLTRADYRRSFAKLCELVGALHRAGVPIVAGTDGSGMELVRETRALCAMRASRPAEALAERDHRARRTCVGADARTGSIAVGKQCRPRAGRGDPSRHIGDLRHTRIVMMDGKLMDADALRAAGGFAGRRSHRLARSRTAGLQHAGDRECRGLRRQGKGEARAAARALHRGDAAAMRIDDGSADGEPEPGAAEVRTRRARAEISRTSCSGWPGGRPAGRVVDRRLAPRRFRGPADTVIGFPAACA